MNDDMTTAEVSAARAARVTSESGAAAGGASLTNAEAAECLRHANSGVHPDLSRLGYRAAKRIFDIVASGAAIVVLLVPGAVLSVVICLKSPGAGPLYSQLRVGRLRRDGSYRLFRMWKFRSMVPHADEMLRGLADKNEADGPLFKIKFTGLSARDALCPRQGVMSLG